MGAQLHQVHQELLVPAAPLQTHSKQNKDSKHKDGSKSQPQALCWALRGQTGLSQLPLPVEQHHSITTGSSSCVGWDLRNGSAGSRKKQLHLHPPQNQSRVLVWAPRLPSKKIIKKKNKSFVWKAVKGRGSSKLFHAACVCSVPF